MIIVFFFTVATIRASLVSGLKLSFSKLKRETLNQVTSRKTRA